LDQISACSKEEVIDFYKNLISKVKENKKKEDMYYSVYYKHIKKALDLKDCFNFLENKKNNKSTYPVDQPKPKTNFTALKSKIIDKDDFPLPSPGQNAPVVVVNNPSGNNPNNNQNTNQIIEEAKKEDEFIHEDI